MAGSLSEDEKKDMKVVFDSFDKDGNGTICSKELGAAMKACGQTLGDAELDQLMKAVDTNNSGHIDFAEFLTLVVSAVNYKPSEKDVLAQFKEFDKDGNGYISKAEIKTALQSFKIEFTEDELNDMIKTADKDGDGRVNYEEFAKMWA